MTTKKRPIMDGTRVDGNIFSVLGAAGRTLRSAGLGTQADEMRKRVTSEAKDYHHALGIIMEYVDIRIAERKAICCDCGEEFDESEMSECRCPDCYEEYTRESDEDEEGDDE